MKKGRQECLPHVSPDHLSGKTGKGSGCSIVEQTFQSALYPENPAELAFPLPTMKKGRQECLPHVFPRPSVRQEK